jgi:hypothetical protein
MTRITQRARPAAEYLALRDACRRLVVAGGGVHHAAKLTDAAAATLARYYHDDAGAWMGVDKLLDLEGATGKPIVSAVLAELLGYRLVPNDPCGMSVVDVLAVVVEVGEYAGSVQAMDADGARSVSEIRAAITEAQGVLQAAQSNLNGLFGELEVALNGVRGGVDAGE